MKLKDVILSVMGHDALVEAVDSLGLDGVDRRSEESMRGWLSRERRATAARLLACLGDNEIERACDLVGVPAKGDRDAVIAALLGAGGDGSAAEAPGGNHGAVNGGKPGRGRSNPGRPGPDQPLPMHGKRRARAGTSAHPGRLLRIARTELVWPGKYDDSGVLVEPPRVGLPLRVTEVVAQEWESLDAMGQSALPLFGKRRKDSFEGGWRNKLIVGDNQLVASSLLAEFAGKIDLIYIDPPFATGADFGITTRVGEDTTPVMTRRLGIEENAYRDTWRTGIDSYLAMLWGRLRLMRELLADTGTIFVHCDWHVGHLIRCVLDDVFGADAFKNEIVWRYRRWPTRTRVLQRMHDTILWYGKTATDHHRFKTLYEPLAPSTVHTFGTKRQVADFSAGYRKPGQTQEESPGAPMSDVWEIGIIAPIAHERTGYPTQKPEALLDRILEIASEPGDLVADFFCGSGTTLAVAEKLGRRWIGCDFGRFAIHTTQKRLLDLRVKDPASGTERGCRPFEVVDLGRHERTHWQRTTFGGELDASEEDARAACVEFVLRLGSARPVRGTLIHGTNGRALVHVGAVDVPVTVSEVEDAAAEAARLGGNELHVLGWEFEADLQDWLAPPIRARRGIVVRLFSIPREAMDRSAVEAGHVRIFELPVLGVTVKPVRAGKKERSIKVVLDDFVVSEAGFVANDRSVRIEKWSDYVDAWAVDWDFRGGAFVQRWESHRTRKERALKLETPIHTYDKPGVYQIMVKVVDIFGNDTRRIVKWDVQR